VLQPAMVVVLTVRNLALVVLFGLAVSMIWRLREPGQPARSLKNPSQEEVF
jgi:hypothetical protein